MFNRPRLALLATISTSLALALSACSAPGQISASPGDRVANSPCGSVRIAVNPWTGSAANAHVIGQVAAQRLGCQVSYMPLTEEQNWGALDRGEVDIVPEVWGHEAFAAQYVDVRKTIVDAGPTGGDGTIGWFVPEWMAREYPGITSWENLNTYASLFRTPTSGTKGQLLTDDPANVSSDGALVANLRLDFVVVRAGSERELAQAFRDAEHGRTPLLAFFHAPQWVFTELRLARVKLPAYDSKNAQCARGVEFRCDYPQYALNKFMSASFAKSGSPAAALAADFSWTNRDQNLVAAGIDREAKSADEAAKAWVEANRDKVDAWVARALG